MTIVLKKDAAWTHTAAGAGSEGDGAGWRRVALEFDGPHHFIVLVHKAKNFHSTIQYLVAVVTKN